MNDSTKNNPPPEKASPTCPTSIRWAIEDACRRIPPLWPLRDFVAVNPFLGLSDRHFLQAAALLRRTAHGDILMSRDDYLQRLDSGGIEETDIQEAVALARLTLPPPWSKFLKDHNIQSLRQELLAAEPEDGIGRIVTVADCLDHSQNTAWAPFVTEEVSKWCSVYFDQSQSSWRMPWRDLPFYAAWREAARHDANPGLSGLKNFTQIVECLPQDPALAVQQALEALEIPPGLQADFLHRQLLSISGWSSYLQYQVRQRLMPGTDHQGLTEILAVRLAYDQALRDLGSSLPGFDGIWRENVVSMQEFRPNLDLLPRYILQLALEMGYQRRLVQSLRFQSGAAPRPAQRPALQAIFCIDVRSEVYRRHLEAQNPAISTSGFAGFFGMPVEYLPPGQEQGLAQCPVLLSPKFKVREKSESRGGKNFTAFVRNHLSDRYLNYSWNSFKTSAVSCFTFVESSGLLFGLKLGMAALGRDNSSRFRDSGNLLQLHSQYHGIKSGENATASDFGIPEADQLDLAENALRNLGLTQGFARLVLFCGHGSATTNNPYASGLDCGACGGHSGHVNARVIAGILNEAPVRRGLAQRGIAIPTDTHFVAGLHTTTTDDVAFFGERLIPSSHREEWEKAKAWLKQASALSRKERSTRLGLSSGENQLDKKIRNRSLDWSQVRPEWGLATNAALIAAPRERTRGLNLEGRTFLHDYDTDLDPEGSVLELILTAPVIVAHWINLQYYASTTNNRLFGSGDKTIHNVVGGLGIWQGNGGDLQTGLPLQSLHDGNSWVHEPLRLGVFIEAPRDWIRSILLKHNHVSELVENQWMHLFAMEDKGSAIFRYSGQSHWIALD